MGRKSESYVENNRQISYVKVALLILSVLIISLTWRMGINLGYDIAKPSPRYTLYSIPIVLSKFLGKSYDYTSFSEVSAVFHHGEGDVNSLINTAMSPKFNINRETSFFISGDDKGLVDFTLIAFKIFGQKQESLYHTFFLLLSFGVLIFTIKYYKEISKMLFLSLILLSLYIINFTFSISEQSNSIIEPRFLGILGIIPLFHLLFMIRDENHLTPLAIFCAIVQALMIVFVLHVRSSEIWQISCVVSFSFLIILAKKIKKFNYKILKKERGINFKSVGLAVAPIIVLFGLLGFYQFYKILFYHPQYFEKYLTTRVLWHNALMGLSVHPGLRAKYDLIPLEDISITRAVQHFLQEKGDWHIQNILFKNPIYYGGNFKDFNWNVYEPIARDLYFKIVFENPFDIINTYFLLMPKVFVANTLYMAGIENIFPDSLYLISEKLDKDIYKKNGFYSNLFRFETICILIMIICIMFWYQLHSRIEFKWLFISLISVLLFSLVPPFLAMPVIQYIQISLVLLMALMYLFGIFFVYTFLDIILRILSFRIKNTKYFII